MAFEAITPLTEAEACEAFKATPVPDPHGIDTPASLARAGQAFAFHAGGGKCAAVIRKNGDQLWIQAAAGSAADDLTSIGLALGEETARQAGCKEVAFQTARAGLVKKASQHGYQVVGWIMKKRV